MPRGELVGPVVPRTIEGTGKDVERILQRIKARGDLVSPIPKNLVPMQRVVVHVHVIQRPERRRVQTRWVVAGVAGGTVALGGAGFLAYLATAELVANALPFLGGLILLMLLLGWVGAGQAGACPGLHCPGCKCHR